MVYLNNKYKYLMESHFETGFSVVQKLYEEGRITDEQRDFLKCKSRPH